MKITMMIIMMMQLVQLATLNLVTSFPLSVCQQLGLGEQAARLHLHLRLLLRLVVLQEGQAARVHHDTPLQTLSQATQAAAVVVALALPTHTLASARCLLRLPREATLPRWIRSGTGPMRRDTATVGQRPQPSRLAAGLRLQPALAGDLRLPVERRAVSLAQRCRATSATSGSAASTEAPQLRGASVSMWCRSANATTYLTYWLLRRRLQPTVL